jgi:hypothetical protein
MPQWKASSHRLLIAQDERFGKKVYHTRAQAKADVFDYIEFITRPDATRSWVASAPSTSNAKLE